MKMDRTLRELVTVRWNLVDFLARKAFNCWKQEGTILLQSVAYGLLHLSVQELFKKSFESEIEMMDKLTLLFWAPTETVHVIWS